MAPIRPPVLNGFPIRLMVPRYCGTYWVTHPQVCASSGPHQNSAPCKSRGAHTLKLSNLEA